MTWELHVRYNVYPDRLLFRRCPTASTLTTHKPSRHGDTYRECQRGLGRALRTRGAVKGRAALKARISRSTCPVPTHSLLL